MTTIKFLLLNTIAKPKSSKAPLAAASSYEPMQSAVAALQPMKNHHTLISDEEKVSDHQR